MRHELCIDNRNEPKWSVGLNAADRVGACALVYAAMYVPDVERHGNEMQPWDGPVRQDVAQFFAGERAHFQAGQPKNLWRIAHLDGRIKCVTDTYRGDQQPAYVQKVISVLSGVRIGSDPLLLLVDPCNGIADGQGNAGNRDLRIRSESVAELWTALQQGDVLVIWQWPQPERIPANNPVDLLTAAIKQAKVPLPPGGIQVHPFGPFVMIELQK